MTTGRRLGRLEEHTRRRAHAVMTAVFNAAQEDCLVVARMARPGFEPTPEDREALDRVNALMREELVRAGFDPDAPPVPGLVDGWTAPGPYGRAAP